MSRVTKGIFSDLEFLYISVIDFISIYCLGSSGDILILSVGEAFLREELVETNRGWAKAVAIFATNTRE